MDRLPYDTTLDGPDEPREPLPEQDPDEARQQMLDDVRDGLRDPPAYLTACERHRQRDVDLAEKAGRLCPHGDAYVRRAWPFD